MTLVRNKIHLMAYHDPAVGRKGPSSRLKPTHKPGGYRSHHQSLTLRLGNPVFLRALELVGWSCASMVEPQGLLEGMLSPQSWSL